MGVGVKGWPWVMIGPMCSQSSPTRFGRRRMLLCAQRWRRSDSSEPAEEAPCLAEELVHIGSTSLEDDDDERERRRSRLVLMDDSTRWLSVNDSPPSFPLLTLLFSLLGEERRSRRSFVEVTKSKEEQKKEERRAQPFSEWRESGTKTGSNRCIEGERERKKESE